MEMFATAIMYHSTVYTRNVVPVVESEVFEADSQ